MQAAIDRVYSMMVNLTAAQEDEAREKVSNFLKEKVGDEHHLAVEGLKIFTWPRAKATSAASSP